MAKPPQSIKPLIAPFQLVLINQGKCGGCLTDLKEGEIEHKSNNEELVTCKCRRAYIHNTLKDTYRRALSEEL